MVRIVLFGRLQGRAIKRCIEFVKALPPHLRAVGVYDRSADVSLSAEPAWFYVLRANAAEISSRRAIKLEGVNSPSTGRKAKQERERDRERDKREERMGRHTTREIHSQAEKESSSTLRCRIVGRSTDVFFFINARLHGKLKTIMQIQPCPSLPLLPPAPSMRPPHLSRRALNPLSHFTLVADEVPPRSSERERASRIANAEGVRATVQKGVTRQV